MKSVAGRFNMTGLPCSVEVASEYRYRRVVVPEGTLFLAVSQSGETADTLAALRDGRNRGYLGSLAICNVPESSLVRESDLVLMTRAGPEIGVASTKAFTTQLAALALLAIELARLNGATAEKVAKLVAELATLPRVVGEVLKLEPEIATLAERFVPKHHALFLGRGVHYPVALEGALKLKEISYIHAEAYPAGELKHGPLALVDEDMPCSRRSSAPTTRTRCSHAQRWRTRCAKQATWPKRAPRRTRRLPQRRPPSRLATRVADASA